MIEVEVKLPVRDIETLKQKLAAQGFLKGKSVKEEDIYFNSPVHDFRKRDEALRVRRVTMLKEGTSTSFLTYKGPKMDQVSMTRKELETGIEDMDIMRKVIHALGFELEYPVTKTREYYQKERMTACVDQVDFLGDFLELEVLVEEEAQREQALYIIEEMLKELGYEMADTTRTSYLTMLMKKGMV